MGFVGSDLPSYQFLQMGSLKKKKGYCSVRKGNQSALGLIKDNPKSKKVINIVIIRERLYQDSSGFSTDIRGIY